MRSWRREQLEQALGLPLLTAQALQHAMRMAQWTAVKDAYEVYARELRDTWAEERWGEGQLVVPESVRLPAPRESIDRARRSLSRVLREAAKNEPSAVTRVRMSQRLKILDAMLDRIATQMLPKPQTHDSRQLALSFA